MKTALAQIDIIWESPADNLEKAARFVEKAASMGCDVVVFPEMFSSGFSMNPAFAETENGPADRALSALALKYGINIIAGYALKKEGAEKPENTACVYDRNGSPAARYSKIHPFSYAGEDRVFEKGRGPVVFSLDGTPAGVFICYDLRFPEVFRKIAEEVRMIFVLANWPASRAGHWNALLKARAIENQCHVIGVNRTGRDGNGIDYSGGSMVFGPSGELLCAASEQEELLVCDIDPAETDLVRAGFPFLRDMRFI